MPICSYLYDRVCPIFSGAGKFCLAPGLRQLTRDIKNDVRILYFRSDATFVSPMCYHQKKSPNNIRRRSLCDLKCHKIRNGERYLIIFNVIGKKNNQISVYYAD